MKTLSLVIIIATWVAALLWIVATLRPPVTQILGLLVIVTLVGAAMASATDDYWNE